MLQNTADGAPAAIAYSTGLHRQVRCETTRALPTSHTWA